MSALPAAIEPQPARAGATSIEEHIPVHQRDGRARAALVAAVLGFFVITLDAVVVNVALPVIRADLGGGLSGLQWVVDGYTLTFAALLLAAGSVTDRVGARSAFGAGLIVFTLASLGCGLAPNLASLVGARFVQGAGAALVMPSSMALVRRAFPEPAARGRAVAIWAMGGAIASSSGPVLGGLLSLASWRLIFLINVPVAVVALLVLARTRPSPTHRVGFDWAGQITGVLAMGGLIFGVIEGGAHGFARPEVIVALSVAAVAAVAFVLVQARVVAPTVPLELIGAVLTPFSARIVECTGPRTPVVTGLVLLATGAAALAATPATAPVWVLALLLILVGLAGPLVMPPMTAVLLSSVQAHRSGVASGVFNTSRQVGGALAVAVFGALTATAGGFLHGLRISLIIIAAVAVTTAAAAFPLKTRAESS